LEADKPLQECKAMVIVHGRSLAEVMKGLAAVFGGQWVTLERNGKDVYQLRYLKVVADYLAFRDQARQKACEDARQRQYQTIMNQINYVFAHLDDPKDPGVSHVIGANGLPLVTSVQDMSLARLLKLLPGDDVQRFARALADAIPVENVIDGDSHTAVLHAPPVILPQGGLTPAESSLAQQFLANQSHDAALSGIAANPAGVSLGLTSDSSSDLGIAWVIPGQAHAPFSKAFSFFHSPSSVLAAEVTANMNATLAKRPFPPEALLDAAIDKDGNPQPAASLQPDLAGKMVDLEGNPPLRWQLLAFLGEHAALNVISDYATLGERMTLPRGPQTLQRDLELASKSYGAVFREDGAVLLARYVDWPDLNEEEAPWPLPEGWIQEKTKGRGLGFGDYIALAGLDTAQLNALARYQDRNVSFAKNLSSLRGQSGFRPLLASCASLSAQDRAKIAAGGLPYDVLPIGVQRQIAQLPLVQHTGANPGRLVLQLLKSEDSPVQVTDANGFPTGSLNLEVRDAVSEKHWLAYYTLGN
ncbi:MAG TPA: hypothetical protein VFJ58_24625, partial [Armatimonadota bacterium]|nr:hypothetical protein [Armatimonadota bacterium]